MLESILTIITGLILLKLFTGKWFGGATFIPFCKKGR